MLAVTGVVKNHCIFVDKAAETLSHGDGACCGDDGEHRWPLVAPVNDRWGGFLAKKEIKHENEGKRLPNPRAADEGDLLRLLWKGQR
jgi:hypothetical protein